MAVLLPLLPPMPIGMGDIPINMAPLYKVFTCPLTRANSPSSHLLTHRSWKGVEITYHLQSSERTRRIPRAELKVEGTPRAERERERFETRLKNQFPY